MKCIVYVSEFIVRDNGATIPTGLSDIYRKARSNNKKLIVTGILSFHRGLYLQVLEGETNTIDALFSKIKTDSRHKNIIQLLDFSISTRSFSGEHMKLLPTVKNDDNFISFAEKNRDRINSLDINQRKLFEVFYSLKHSSSDEYSLNLNFENKDIMLSKWPDFTVIHPSPAVIELCAQLVDQPTPFNSLLNNKEFSERQELEVLLIKLSKMGILKLTSSKSIKLNSPQASGFYSKVKLFLRLNT